MDGLSTDETFSIVKRHEAVNPALWWFSERDKGIYDAMNKGIELAKGEWIYFLGSDDLIHDKDVLQEVYSLDKSEYQVVYGNAKIIGKTAWAKEGHLYDGEFDLQKLLKKNICQQAMFYHNSCFTDTTSLFNIDYEICADWDFNLRCWARKEFLFVDITIVDFYGGGASTRKNANREFYDDFDKNILRYFGPNVVNNVTGKTPAQRELPNARKKLLFAKNWLKNKLKPNDPHLSK
jgi:glycosyltransferase involved in cell wall biosynthesis